MSLEFIRKKNSATRIVFPLIDDDGDVVSGATGLDSEYSQYSDSGNPGAWADCASEAVEISSSGVYYLPLSASEVNADYIEIQIKSNAKTQHLCIRTMTNIAAVPAEIADSVWDEARTDHTAAGSFGEGVAIKPDGIAASTFDESTAFPIGSADSGATQIARKGADADTLKTLSDQVDSLEVTKLKLENMVEADGADYRYKTNALEQAPTGPSEGTIANAVWDEAKADHVAPNSFGKAVGDIDTVSATIVADFDLTQALISRIGNSGYTQRTVTYASGAVVAQGITVDMATTNKCIQYITVKVSLVRDFGTPDLTFYELYHYDVNTFNDIKKFSSSSVW